MTKFKKKLRLEHKNDDTTVMVNIRTQDNGGKDPQDNWFLAVVDDDGYLTIHGVHGCPKFRIMDVLDSFREHVGYPCTIVPAESRKEAQEMMMAAIKGRKIKTTRQLGKAWEEYFRTEIEPEMWRKERERRNSPEYKAAVQRDLELVKAGLSPEGRELIPVEFERNMAA